MSTRTLLKGRRYYFKTALKKEPDHINAKNIEKAISEIDFILKALETYVYDKK